MFLTEAIDGRTAWAGVVLIMAAIGLGWLRIRRERRARSRHEAEIRSIQSTRWDGDEARRNRRSNQSRRLWISLAFVLLGLAIGILDSERVIKRTNIPVGFALAGFGILMAAASILCLNIFHGGPYDMRLDPPADNESD